MENYNYLIIFSIETLTSALKVLRNLSKFYYGNINYIQHIETLKN